MVDRVALPISRQRAQNPMGNRTRVIRVGVGGTDEIIAWNGGRLPPPPAKVFAVVGESDGNP